MAGPLPKARTVLKADAAFRAVLGLVLLAGAPLVLEGAAVFAQAAGALLVGWAVALKGAVATGAPAVRLVAGGNAVASLLGVVVVFSWMPAAGAAGGFAATAPAAVVALALLVFGVFSALYWGRLKGVK
ncbi:hypothetical protein [Caenispirillum salinarum]|uniref:hypothetical protein n=1 Tax=Caenispirillum salinarum TaxID=859058 RepID=UPI00384C200E